MTNLTAGPALGAYQAEKALNQVLTNFRIHQVNCPDQPPHGYEDFIEFLRACQEEAESYWPKLAQPAEPKKRVTKK